MLRAGRFAFAVPSAVYSQGLTAGKLRPCPKQHAALEHVDRLYTDVIALKSKGIPKRDIIPYTPEATPSDGAAGDKKSGTFFSSFIGSSAAQSVPSGPSSRKAAASSAPRPKFEITHPLSQTRGLYLHGDVGCGKSHLMDMFYEELPSAVHKKRVHFHQFMQQVHKDMHAIKSTHGKHMDGDQLMREVAKKQCRDAEVLCFDELVVADVADAMILRRLFENMYAVGVCTVFTSNRAPPELYKDGLNREAFLPFISLLHDRCHVHDMSSGTDHRLVGTKTETFLQPVNPANTARFEAEWRQRTKGDPERPVSLTVFGRQLPVKRAVNGACRFTFRDLCNSDIGVADYSEIAKAFHTVFLEDIPQMPPGNSDSKRRFITLLDELYQYKTKVFVLANVPLEQLEMPQADDGSVLQPDSNEETFYAGQLIGAGEDKFQMRRAISRLQEMRTEEYANAKHLGGAAGSGSA